MTVNIPTLNCTVGDLAITVNCNVPENLGNIVRVKSPIGMKEWGAHNELLFSWEVEVATDHGWLLYEFNGYPVSAKNGPVPDHCLRRITPPQGYLMEEFADSEQLQLSFHELDL